VLDDGTAAPRQRPTGRHALRIAVLDQPHVNEESPSGWCEFSAARRTSPLSARPWACMARQPETLSIMISATVGPSSLASCPFGSAATFFTLASILSSAPGRKHQALVAQLPA
jgi:hypothetical protein